MLTDPFNARILIVDDQPSNVRLLEHTLHRGGYVAATSTTEPCEVCALHRANRYDLIILDLQMPRMNGFAVMGALKECAGELPAILVMSANPLQRQQSMDAGAAGFLGKPFMLADVLGAVAALLLDVTAPVAA